MVKHLLFRGKDSTYNIMENDMDNINIKISKDDALKLLTNEKDETIKTKKIFDKYGNYIFPTDIEMKTPNSVCGTVEQILIK